MHCRGQDLNWFDFVRDIWTFHESPFSTALQKVKETDGLKSGIGRLDGSFLYVLARWCKPETIVETGTYQGFSAAYFIEALKDNGGTGRIYSIDVDQSRNLDPVISSEDQRRYLTRIEGNSLKVVGTSLLPRTIDLFFHDSVHRRDYQMAEFQAFWQLLRVGGVLASHDVTKNSSFSEFCTTTYSHDARGYADDRTRHSFWGVLASSGFIQKCR